MPTNEFQSTCPGALRCAMDALELGHAQWVAGYQLGLIHGQRMAAETLAAELLHKQACEMAGIAVSTARGRFGNEWAESIREAAS